MINIFPLTAGDISDTSLYVSSIPGVETTSNTTGMWLSSTRSTAVYTGYVGCGSININDCNFQ